MNPWEVQALNVRCRRYIAVVLVVMATNCSQYEFPDETVAADGSTTKGTWRQVEDPVIYPGLYSASGIDVMSILVRSLCHISINDTL